MNSKIKNIIRKIIILGMVVIWAFGVLGCNTSNEIMSTTEQQEIEELKEREPDRGETFESLSHIYDADKESADKQYKGRYMWLSKGTIKDYQFTGKDRAINLKSWNGTAKTEIVCKLHKGIDLSDFNGMKESDLKQKVKDGYIEVQGIIEGLNEQGEVVVDKCFIKYIKIDEQNNSYETKLY